MSRSADTTRDAVREAYASVARARGASEAAGGGCCGPAVPASEGVCCGTEALPIEVHAARLGYGPDDLAEAVGNLGVGCGNPTAIAALRSGDVVVDLGAGGGFDCFLAAKQVGDTGRVIGVDMTPDMLATARRNAAKVGFANVEFRLGEIEHLPVADGTVDVILSNCVINLSPDKPQVFREAFRVLKAGGRLAVSDVVAVRPLPQAMRDNLHLVSCCIGGAADVADLTAWMQAAGFTDIRIEVKAESREVIRDWAPETGAEDYVASATIEATKPAARGCCG